MRDSRQYKQEIIVSDDTGRAVIYPSFIENPQDWFPRLRDEIPWRQDEITLFGKTHPIPRLQSFHGEEGISYTYSNLRMKAEAFSGALLGLKELVNLFTGQEFNCVLCNYYRSGRDYAAWHQDNEKELGKNPAIASVSFGATRRFDLRNLETGKTIKTELPEGSLLLMDGALQHFWKHQLAKTARYRDERINLTFRKIRQ